MSNAFLNFLASLKAQTDLALTLHSESTEEPNEAMEFVAGRRKKDLFSDLSYAGRLTSNGLGSMDIGGGSDWPSSHPSDIAARHGLG